MKTYARQARTEYANARLAQGRTADRVGTVIILVLALLGLLALIGFFALGFTSQENQSATYFANSPTAKNLTTTLDPNSFFNDILRQLIIGPSITEKQSVLWGGNKSLLPAMFGRDLAPYSGAGVNLIWNTTLPPQSQYPAIDQNYDGTPDTVTAGQPNLMQLNFSPAAQGGNVLNFNSFSSDVTVYPDPDTNITYPDINNAYLAADTLVPNGVANPPVRLITPSFHRPMFLRTLAPSTQWYTSNTTAPYVLFPHAAHLAVDSSGNAVTSPTPQYRFVTGINPDTSNIGTALVPFPIPGDPANAALTPPWPGGPVVQEGVWTAWASNSAYALSAQVVPIPPNGQVFQCTSAGTSGATVPAWPTTTGSTVTDGGVVWTAMGPANIGYDIDTDNDGIPDARYMDFGFPLMQDTYGNQFVALAAVKIMETDSLFNLNVHGNRAATAQIPVPNNFAGGTNPAFLSLSDHGVSASEVNPLWALNARPIAGSPDFTGNSAALSAALQQYVLLFRPSGSGSNPTNNFDSTAGALSYELANMEWWNLLNGRPQLAAGSPPTVSGSSFVGRWGENVTRLDPNVAQILAGTTLSAGVSVSNDPFPLPGTSGFDDNNNSPEGGNFYDPQFNVFYPAFVQPIDFFAGGYWVTGTQGKQRQVMPGTTTSATLGNEQFPAYSQFFVAPTVGWANVFAAALMPSGGSKLLIDEPDETFTEPSVAAQQPNDNIFDASENAVQLSGGDYSALGSPGRTASLMPFNFVSSQRAALIRQRFTSTSWDLKSFGKEFFGADTTAGAGPYDARRLWEFTDTSSGATGAGPFRFPPSFGSTSTANGVLPPNLSPFATISPYANANDDATTSTSGTNTSGGTGVSTPTTTFVYPMRTAVSSLLQVLANPNLNTNPATGPYTTGALPQTSLVQPQRLLSINGLTEMYKNGSDSNGNPIYQFRFRPLTPHPSTVATNFANTQIIPFPAASQGSITIPSVPWIAEPEQLGSAGASPSQAYMQQQEWLARYDRQRMARDIYTTLYLMGGGADTAGIAVNYAATSNQPTGTPPVRPVYTDDQLQEMAQFAVNLVDALDPDSNITVFEYDKDLSDGWNLDDNAYDNGTNDPLTTTHPNDRGVVYGVERQQLCLNEAMVTLSQKCVNTALANIPQDHPDTQWLDTNVWSFLYLELENAGPTPITFQNAQWQIAVKQSPITAAPSAYYGTGAGTSGEMRMILTGPNAQSGSTLQNVAAGTTTGGPSQRMTIGGMIGSSTGAQGSFTIVDNVNPTSSAPHPSYMVVNPNDMDPTYGSTPYNNQFPIAPRSAYISPNPSGGPYQNTTALAPASGGLDLIDPTQQNNYWIVPPNTSTAPGGSSADGPAVTAASLSGVAPGSQLLQFNDPSAQILPSTSPVVLRVELRRRADLNRAAILPSDTNQVAEASDNPWVVVDYMDVPVSVLALKITGNNADFYQQIQYQLGHLSAPPVATGASYYNYGPSTGSPNVSTERTQPLYHDYGLNPFNPSSSNPTTPNGPFTVAAVTNYPRNGGSATLMAPLWQANSFGQDNDAAGFNPGTIPSSTAKAILPHTLYQPHYDRDFSSVGELFNIPLYGPYGPQSPNTLTTNTPGTGSSVSLSSGLTHLMGSRISEAGTVTAGPAPTTELLVGADYVPTDTSLAKQHYVGYGTAGFRFQHPEGGDQTNPNPDSATGTSDFTENRWFRLLGMVEVPTRSHRGIQEPNYVYPYQVAAGSINGSLGFFRTPGKINLNTLRYPDIVAGLIGEPDIFNMNFSPQLPSGVSLPSGLSIPYLLQDITGDTVANAPPQNPAVAGSTARDWWEQFVATRDGVDPLPVVNGGTGLSIPGLPRAPSGTAPPAGLTVTAGSHPFRGMNFSAYGAVDANGYNGPLESNLLRSLSGDAVTTGGGTFDLRRRLFELGTTTDHSGSAVDYATKQRLLARMAGNTTTRSNVFLVWIQVDFFQAKDVGPSLTPADTGVVRIGSKLGTSPAYRGFFVIDRSQALPLMAQQYLPATDPTSGKFVFSLNQSFNWQSLVLYRQRIQ